MLVRITLRMRAPSLAWGFEGVAGTIPTSWGEYPQCTQILSSMSHHLGRGMVGERWPSAVPKPLILDPPPPPSPPVDPEKTLSGPAYGI